MAALRAGITLAGECEGGVVWNILGQTLRPLASCDSCFAFDALFPPGTFVPPHIHATQDEFIRVLDGRLDLTLDGQALQAAPGDLIRLPMGIIHGVFNKSGAPAHALFWVSPARGLRALFTRIHNLPDPADVIRIASEYEVTFPPPPG